MSRTHLKRFMNVVLLAGAAALFVRVGAANAAEPGRAAATVITGDLSTVEDGAQYVLNSAVATGNAMYLVLQDAASAGDVGPEAAGLLR